MGVMRNSAIQSILQSINVAESQITQLGDSTVSLLQNAICSIETAVGESHDAREASMARVREIVDLEFSKLEAAMQRQIVESTLLVQDRAEKEMAARREAESVHGMNVEDLKHTGEEDIQALKANFEEKIFALKEQYNTSVKSYNQSTDGLLADYKVYLSRDVELSDEVSQKSKQIDRLVAEVSELSKRFAAQKAQWEEENEKLMGERREISASVSKLKVQLSGIVTRNSRKVADLSVFANDCRARLNELWDLAEKARKLNELCARFEDDAERLGHALVPKVVLSVGETNVKSALGSELTEESQNDALETVAEMKEPIRSAGLLAEHEFLEGFYKRYNKVLLDLTLLTQSPEQHLK